MKVKVIKVDEKDDNWYKLGEVLDVKPYFVSKHGINFYPCEDSERDVYGVDVNHCEVIREESLQSVDGNTEQKETPEYTGSSVSYYSVPIKNPQSKGDPYTAECNDIIKALKMNYAEGNAFKAIWRSCAARNLGKTKKGYDSGLYDAEKVVFFGNDMIEQAKDRNSNP